MAKQHRTTSQGIFAKAANMKVVRRTMVFRRLKLSHIIATRHPTIVSLCCRFSSKSADLTTAAPAHPYSLRAGMNVYIKGAAKTKQSIRLRYRAVRRRRQQSFCPMAWSMSSNRHTGNRKINMLIDEHMATLYSIPELVGLALFNIYELGRVHELSSRMYLMRFWTAISFDLGDAGSP